MALQELWSNKLRTFLSIIGITIGIFCVISVLMMVESVEKNLKDSLEELGDDVVYIDRFPWDGGNGKWWEYIRRPYPSYRDFKAIEKRMTSAEYSCIRIVVSDRELKYKNNVLENVPIAALSYECDEIFNLEFGEGRYFSLQESTLGHNVIILGFGLAEQLFPTLSNPIGKQIRVAGLRLRVVGILKKEGESILGDGFDNLAFTPYNHARRFTDVNSRTVRPLIAVKAREEVSLDQLKDEVTSVLRAHRKIRPKEEDNFALNQVSILTSVLDGIFGIVNVAGWIIGLFSILVGGFGIANIMFVSVKERTNIIGIKKSLGAKNYFILFEFLIEAVCLCFLGGLVGLILVKGAVMLGNLWVESFTLVLSNNKIFIGIFISMIIGVIAGFVPALSAAKMNPVEAIRHN